MRPEIIKARLVEAGISMIDISRRLGLDRSVVSSVISGRGRSARVQRAIARRLGVPVKTLFPGYKPGRAKKAEARQ